MPNLPSEPGKAQMAGMKIVVPKSGPYIVLGDVPLALQSIMPNKEGFSWEWKQGKTFKTEGEYHLCRCGGSK